MGRTIEAEYLEEDNVLKLTEPLAGIRDHAQVAIEVKEYLDPTGKPWLALAGSLSEEAGRELARTIRDAFGRDNIDV